MKDKILTIVIGVLIGAILTTAGFLIYINMNQKSTQPVTNKSFMHQMQNGNEQFPNRLENMPNNQNVNNMQEPPPEMPSEINNEASQDKTNKQQVKGDKSIKGKTKTITDNNSTDA